MLFGYFSSSFCFCRIWVTIIYENSKGRTAATFQFKIMARFLGTEKKGRREVKKRVVL